MIFRTHTGELVDGARLKAALGIVADSYIESAHAVRREDAYASHVTEEEKDKYLAHSLAHAVLVRAGEIQSFAVWQRVNQTLTGECVGFLPK